MTTTSATIARDTITRAQLRLICAAAAGHVEHVNTLHFDDVPTMLTAAATMTAVQTAITEIRADLGEFTGPGEALARQTGQTRRLLFQFATANAANRYRDQIHTLAFRRGYVALTNAVDDATAA